MGRATLFAHRRWHRLAATAVGAPGILLLMLLSDAAAYSQQTVRVGGGYSPVLSFAGKDGKPTGFFVEVMREATERAGYRFEWTFHPAGMESALSTSAVHIWAAASPTEARRRLFLFTRPWWSHDYHILIRGSSQGEETDADLAGKRVLTDRKAPPLQVPPQRLFPKATIAGVEGSEAAVIAVCRGEADAFLVQEPSLAQLLLQRPAPCDGVPLRSLVGPRELVTSLAIASPLKEQKVNRGVRDAIDELIHDGTLARIARRYPQVMRHSALLMLESERRTARVRWTQLATGSVAVLLLGALSAFWMLRSSRRHAHAALLSAQGAAAAKQNFLARISHEVRTPMNAVSGYLEMLKDTPLRADQRQFAEEIARANGGLLAMLNDVLDFSGMQNGNLRLASREYSPAESIDEAIGVLQAQADSKNIDLIVSVHPNVPHLLIGDADRLRQIIVNLLGNAIKYTHYGYVRVECEWQDTDGNEDRSGTLQITVVDTGVGIAPDELKAIFEPFTQVGPAGNRTREGAGLGLAISARLAEAMKGRITVASTVAVGSRFQLQVPAVRPSGPAVSWIMPFQQERARIVMLARSGANQDVLEGYLERAGLQVVRVESEAALLVAVENGRLTNNPEGLPVWGVGIQPQCLTSSLNVLAGHLRTTRKGRDLAIVLLASLATLAQLDDEDKASVDCLLVPPFGSRSLREIFGDRRHSNANTPASKRVLVVDDNAINRKVASALMEKLGYEVETAPHGLDAVVKTGQDTFSLILMDCQMPVMDGYEATRNIRLREHGGRRTPIIAVTANSRSEGIDRCIEAGMDGFVCKPVTLEALRSAVTEVQS